jgi:hypothetical protein
VSLLKRGGLGVRWEKEALEEEWRSEEEEKEDLPSWGLPAGSWGLESDKTQNTQY